MQKQRWLIASLLGALVSVGVASSFHRHVPAATGIGGAAQKFLAALDATQKAKAQMPYDAPQRVDWHFIPKESRKGLQIREMAPPQRAPALELLQACLSQTGYGKALKIMELESVLQELERGRQGGPLRDPERYYFTIFGDPAAAGRWGVSIEGHHLSLNFVIEGEQVVSSTPAVFAANPATMMSDVAGIASGTRVLADEETLAFELLQSLSESQRQKAVIAPSAPAEIRDPGQPQPPQAAAEGLAAAELNETQLKVLRRLLDAYAQNMPPEVARQRIEAIDQAGLPSVHFAWAGPDRPGVGHYYRVQGPTFLIEFVNTQPDAAGNPANHIHSIWRDMRGDFALPAAGQ